MKVLVLAYYFPPQISVGCFRTQRNVEALASAGVETEILSVRHPYRRFHPYKDPMPGNDRYGDARVTRCREWPVHWFWIPATVISTRLAQLSGLKLNLAELSHRFFYIDIEWGWMAPALAAGRRLLRRFCPDVIYVSCPPFSSARVAQKLARAAGIPYVLDFRDSWLTSAYTHGAQKRRYKATETALLRDAAALIVTTPSDQRNYQAAMQAAQGAEPAPVHLVTNAYDPLMASIPPATATSERLKLLYTGAWDGGARSPERLLAVLAQLDLPWQLTSVGPSNDVLKNLAARYPLPADAIQYLDAVPKSALPPMIAEADALLLVQGEPAPGQPNTHIAAKTFDYLATAKPILALMAAGDNRDFLADYDGVYMADASDDDSIRATLIRLEADWPDQLGTTDRQDFLARYSSAALGAKTAAVLRDAVALRTGAQVRD